MTEQLGRTTPSATGVRPLTAALLAIALVGVAALAACAGPQPETAGPAPTPGATTAPAPAPATIVFGGYGSIVIGAAEDDVRAADPSAGPSQEFGTCTEIALPGAARNGQNPGYVFGPDHHLIGVRPPAPARTAQGVGVGDTAGRVRAAYPGASLEWVYGYQGTSWVALVSSPANKNATIGFVFDGSNGNEHPDNNAPVIDLASGARDFASGFEICEN